MDGSGSVSKKEGGGLDSPGNAELISGGALAALSIGQAALLSVSCPLCVVAAPALIGMGLYKKIRKKNRR